MASHRWASKDAKSSLVPACPDSSNHAVQRSIVDLLSIAASWHTATRDPLAPSDITYIGRIRSPGSLLKPAVPSVQSSAFHSNPPEHTPKSFLHQTRSHSSIQSKSRDATIEGTNNTAGPNMKWFNRSRGDSATSKGTILRAVPEATDFSSKENHLSPLDDTIITSPKTDILSAFGKPSSEQSHVSYVSPLSPYYSYQAAELPTRTRSIRKHKSADAGQSGYIGTWKNNQIYWASGEVSRTSPKGSTRYRSGDIPISHLADQIAAADLGHDPNSSRRGITVRIPSSKFATRIHPPARFSQEAVRESMESSRPKTSSGPCQSIRGIGKLCKEEIQSIISPLTAMERPQHPLELAAEVDEQNRSRTQSVSSSNNGYTSWDDNASRHSGSTVPSFDVPTPDRRLSTDSNTASRQPFGQDEISFEQNLQTASEPSSPSSNYSSREPSWKHQRATSSTWAQWQIPDSLGAITEDRPLTPDLPPRSQMRDWTAKSAPRNFSRLSSPRHRPTLSNSSTNSLELRVEPLNTGIRRRKTDLDELAPEPVLSQCPDEEAATPISSSAAEAVILKIFENMHDFKDVFAAARINKGFYSVFKRHELQLLKNTMRNISPAAWELRESSPKEIIAALEKPGSEYTPLRYMQFHKRDTYILQALKSLILVRCQSYLRADTIRALADRNAPRAHDINEALWRIWTFCNIFGSGKGREDDIVGQIDWLRGGDIAHQSAPEANLRSTIFIDSSSVLLNPSTSFAKGNAGGLTAEELYDMTELWNCIIALLSPICGPGRIEQARDYNIYDKTGVQVGAVALEERILEEWVYYVSTQGLSTICDLANPAYTSDESVFVVAADMGWNKWKAPQHGGSRSTFLKEAVTRVYEERIAALKSPSSPEDRQEEEAQRHRRLRSAEMAEELKRKKQNMDFSTLPYSEERPMSLWLQWSATEQSPRPQPQTQTQTNADREALGAGYSGNSALSKSILRSSATKGRESSSKLSLFPQQYRDHGTNSAAKPIVATTATQKSVDSTSTEATTTNTSSITTPSSSAPTSARPPRTPPRTKSPVTPTAAQAKAFANAQEIISHVQLPRSPRSPPTTSSSPAGPSPLTAGFSPLSSSLARSPPAITPHSPPAASYFPPVGSYFPPVASYFPPAEPLPSRSPPPPQPKPQPQTQTQTQTHVWWSTATFPEEKKKMLKNVQPVHNINSGRTLPPVPSSSDMAISRLVEMGFEVEDAKMALMKTDKGSGLDVDRAVAVLLARG